MKKVFISIPMNGRSNNEVIDAQQEVLKAVSEYFEGEAVLQIENFFNGNYRITPVECIGESLKLMSKADYVVFAESWENARDCRNEYECAKEYGKSMLVEHGNKIQEFC